MDKSEYLETTYRRLEELQCDSTFKNNLFQVRARAIQEELVPEQTQIKFTFEPKTIWKYCDYLFSESTLLLRENFGDRDVIFKNIRDAAESFEFLAQFADQDEKEILYINSAICYQISGYSANATCLCRLIERNFINNIDSSEASYDKVLTDRFRASLIKLLLKDIKILQQSSNNALSLIKSFQESITSKIAEGELSVDEIFSLTAHGYFHKSILDFVQYCLSGDTEAFSSATENLLKSHRNFEKSRDATLGTIVLELRTVLETFVTRSTWFNLAEYASNLSQDKVWKFYLRNLAVEKNIVEFWQSQLKAIQKNFLTSSDSFIIQMPTSAGKTFIAELAILSALTNNPQGRCLYIAPYRALVYEIENHLTDTLGSIGYRVSTLIGGFEFDAFQEFLLTQSQVLVTTPEKAELLLRTQAEYFNEVITIIIDEGHMLDEGIPTSEEVPENKNLLDELPEQGNLGRGILLELLITRLKIKLPNVKFIFLSAVMPPINASDFVSWLCDNQQDPIRIEPSERPSRQVLAKFEWLDKKGENGEIEYISLPALPNTRHPFVPKFIQRKKYKTGQLTPTGRDKSESWPAVKNKSQTTAMLAVRLSKTGPVLVFCSQTNHVTSVLDNLVTTIKYLEASGVLSNDELRYVENPNSASFYEAVEWLGEDHPLTNALRHNVALHYGPLPDPVRQAIEDEFRSGKIKILISTNTLGQGVNLPVKTVLIYSLERSWSDVDENGNEIRRTRKVRKRDFWNICGRAGRAGKETEGQIIFVNISPRDNELLKEFINQDNIEEVESCLYKLLLALTEKRITQDELIGYLDSYILAILAEEVVDSQDESSINNLLGNSLVGVQALRNNTDTLPLISAISSASSWVVNQVPNSELRKVFASTGLRVDSCKSLEASVSEFLSDIDTKLRYTSENPISCSEEVIHSIFLACQNLREMQLARNVEYHGSNSDEFVFINNWVNGDSVDQLRRELWNPEKSESLSRYLADRIIYKLPWGVNGFLRILAFRLELEYRELPISWQHLPAMIRFGLNNVFACWISSLGVTSRRLALQVAERFEAENNRPDYKTFLRWFINLSNNYVLNELTSPQFQKEKLLKIRNQIVIGDENLQFIRNDLQELVSPVRGISYENRASIASLVRAGDALSLEPELDNPSDPNAVRVLFRNEQIGYIQRDKAKIVSRELQLGRSFEAFASEVRLSDSITTWIVVSIRFN